MEFALGDLRGSEMAAKNALNCRLFIGGSDARIIISPDEAAADPAREGKALRGRAGGSVGQSGRPIGRRHRDAEPGFVASFQGNPAAFAASGSRKRTPFPGRNSMPAASSALFTSSKVDERLGGTPSTLSKRWMVGRLTPARSVNSLAVMFRPARAARI
jgi:hypothetical protein